MSGYKSKILQRLLLTFLSVAMVFSMMNLPKITEAADGAYTVTVKDEYGAAVEGATVNLYDQLGNILNLTETTDNNGTARFDQSDIDTILENAGVETVVVQMTVSKDGFNTHQEDKNINKSPNGEEDFVVELISPTINNVVIEGKELTYNGEAQQLVEVTQIDGDTIEYYLIDENNDETGPFTDVPEATEAKEYKIKVVVQRTGKTDLEKTVTTIIKKATIEGVTLTGKTVPYNGEPQVLVELSGVQDTDNLTWSVNGVETTDGNYPTAIAIGDNYDITLRINRGSNYEEAVLNCNAEITLGNLNIEGLVVTGLDSVYTVDEATGEAVAQKVVTVENQGDYSLMYQLNAGDGIADDSKWSTDIPEVTEAGSYLVLVKAVKENYADEPVEVKKAENAVLPYNVYVAKAEQSLKFDDDDYTAFSTKYIILEGNVPYEKEYVFSATITKGLTGGSITYSVEFEETDEVSAYIDENGKLTIDYADSITVIASIAGDNNYNACKIEYYLEVTGRNGQYIEFENSEVEYTFGTSNTVSDQQAKRINRIYRGTITYSINAIEGLSIGSTSGVLRITDIDKFVEEIHAGKEIIVTATKAATRRYGEDKVTYRVKVLFEPTPENPYTISEADGANGWYKTKATVTAVEGYTVANKPSGLFGATTDLTDQGTGVRYVYLKNPATNAITDRIEIKNIKIDSIAPTALKIEYSELNLKNKIGENLGFYNPYVIITFTAEDEVSGVNHFVWTYTPESGEAVSNVIAVTHNGNVATATLTLPANEAEQMRGRISFTAVDNASNESSITDNYVFVVDTIAPTLSIKYCGEEPYLAQQGSYNGTHFFGGNIDVELTVTEANFYSEDVVVEVSKDGGEKARVNPSWSGNIGTFTLSGDGEYVVYVSYTDKAANKMNDYNSEVLVIDTAAPEISVEYTEADNVIGNESFYNKDVEVSLIVTETNFFAADVKVTVTRNGEVFNFGAIDWSDRNEEGKFIGTFTLKDDGHYIITVDYTDRSNNVMAQYVSNVHTIDKTPPVINVEYKTKWQEGLSIKFVDSDGVEHERKCYNETQEAVITIKEYNFDAEDVDIEIIATDVSGTELDVNSLISQSDWTVDETGELHTVTITYSGDANYNFDIAYTDKATNPAAEYETDYFTVDKTAPKELKIKYSDSVLETNIGSLDYAFYNDKVTVTITAEDDTSGVGGFNYSYLKAEGVSDVNAQLLNVAIENGDIVYSENGKTATVTFVIPKDVLDNFSQFNGTVQFTASDRAGNVSELFADNKRIVVDNIAPVGKVSYNTARNIEGNIHYYNGRINAVININEANFYANDVVVSVTKNGETVSYITPVWTDKNIDEHIGTFSLNGDGSYVITVNYTDKSGNRMNTYTSKQLIIDTKIKAPTYKINGKAASGFAGSYKEDLRVDFFYADENFDSANIKLVRTRFDKVEDVTDKFVWVNKNDNGGSGNFYIPKEVGNDGLYVLKIYMSDKARHQIESEVRFIVNRYGSVYKYSDQLVDLIKDGGQYVKSVENDLVITEYSADRILEDSIQILITRDGKAIDVDYTSNPKNINNKVSVGESGWYEYVYTIKASNFEEDGVYKITLTSKYATVDSAENYSTSVPENSFDEKGNKIVDTMVFTVDTVAPEIRNIVNLDKAIADKNKIIDGKLNVKYTVVDVGGLKSIEIIVNGKTIQTITEKELGENRYNYSGSFDLEEQSGTNAHSIQIKVTDLAGNVTDTNSEDFLKAHSANNKNSTYVFFNKVTVSRNFFVRWYANTGLFWGSIVGTLALIGGSWFFIIAKRRKDEEEDN